jgi:hypothetical protein
VSPQHRILVSGWQSALHWGADEVLVPARALVDGVRVAVDGAAAEVTYYHLVFDRHEIVESEGLLSESYLPGPLTLRGLSPDERAAVPGRLDAVRPGMRGKRGRAPRAGAHGNRSHRLNGLLGRRRRGCGGTGRRTGFRFRRRKAWGFKSLHPHQNMRHPDPLHDGLAVPALAKLDEDERQLRSLRLPLLQRLDARLLPAHANPPRMPSNSFPTGPG